MATRKITLKQAIEFHGHLGPYLVLGLLMGGFALNKLKAKKHFGISVKAIGANKRPKSCLIDGLQLSCGCTYGKGNISKCGGRNIKVILINSKTGKNISMALKESLINELDAANTHPLSEKLAKKIYNLKPKDLFNF